MRAHRYWITLSLRNGETIINEYADSYTTTEGWVEFSIDYKNNEQPTSTIRNLWRYNLADVVFYWVQDVFRPDLTE